MSDITVARTRPGTVVPDADIWAAIAAGTLVLPAPWALTTHETAGRRHLVLSVATAADATAWVEWLNLADLETQDFKPYLSDSGHRRPGFINYVGSWGGWRWTVRGAR